MFEVKAIQAEEGDALLVSYGDTKVRHILVDGGPAGTLPKLLSTLEQCKHRGRVCLEALVVTHYDLDHIEGIIELLQAKPEWLDIKDIWFNGYQHLRPADILGSVEGDLLVELIEKGKYRWNGRFGGKTIKVGNKKALEMPGGLKVWIMSPDQNRLTNLAVEWKNGKIIPEKGEAPPADLLGRKDKWPPLAFADLTAAAKTSDDSKPNGSSIALLLEFDGQRMLLTGDAFASVIDDAINTYWETPPVVHLLKVSHHGSKGNTTDKLLKQLQCQRFLVSTSGKTHGHPDHVLIARLVNSTAGPTELIFNYDRERMANWRNPPRDWPAFKASFPETADCFVRVAL